jgi:hypothetical protein
MTYKKKLIEVALLVDAIRGRSTKYVLAGDHD